MIVDGHFCSDDPRSHVDLQLSFSIVARVLSILVFGFSLSACQNRSGHPKSDLSEQFKEVVRRDQPLNSHMDPRQAVIKSMSLNTRQQIAVLKRLELSTSIRLVVRRSETIEYELSERSTTKIDGNGSWIHQIETTLDRDQRPGHSRQLACLKVDGLPLFKRNSDDWISIQPPNVYDKSCLDTSLTWFSELVGATKAMSLVQLAVRPDDHEWISFTISRDKRAEHNLERLPQIQSNWDALLNEDGRYFKSMLVRYGSLLELDGRIEFHKNTGSVRSGFLDLKYKFSSASPFTMAIRLKTESRPFNDVIELPKYKTISPKVSLKSAYEKLTGYEFNRGNLTPALQPLLKERKVGPGLNKAKDKKR